MTRVAIGPDAPGYIRDAIERAGAKVVEPAVAEALVWTDPFEVAGITALLAGHPHIGWVQLPWAGVERFAAAGVFHDGRTWTCGKGVYAEPVAEHALGLILA